VTEPVEEHVPDGDAVFATAWQTAEYVVRYAPSKGAKFYLVQDFEPWLGPRESLQETWRWPFQKVTVSHWLYEQVCNAEGSAQNTANIPIGIDHERFRLDKDIRQRSKRVAMFYGTASYKTPGDGIAALHMVKQRFPDLAVCLFGQRNRAPKDAPSWAMYQGNVSEPALVAIYNSSSIFLCSSAAEGFALPPAEAMACGCAVVSTDCGGIREFAHHEVTALLSPPGDPEALARNLIRVLEDDALRERLAEAGNRNIRQFTWERSTDRLDRFLQQHVSGEAVGVEGPAAPSGSAASRRGDDCD
jgi:glycosyltransferase involved in cell wall biosynthesis